MESFEEGFYTEDYDQEMLDFIKKNYTINHVNGWGIQCTLLHNHGEFFVSRYDGKGRGMETLTKEQFKKKVGMINSSSDESVFTKDMIKDGMFVKIRGDIYMVLGKVLCSYDRYILLEDYDDGLNDYDQEVWNIQEVYILEGEDNIAPLNYFLSGNGLTSIWKRSPEKTPVQKAIEEDIAIAKQRLLELEKLLEVNSQ